MNCKYAMKQIPNCGKNICCSHCPDKGVCEDVCSDAFDIDPKECIGYVQEETELQVMQSAVPEAIKIITEINIQKKKLDEQEKLMRQKLIEAMETYGVKKFENAQVAFTYVAPTTKTSIDSAKLKKKYPDIAEECSKTSNVSASVRITVK
jgi:hypothetical protein